MGLIDSYELMKELGICRTTLHFYRKKGMPYRQSSKGSAVRFDLAEVEAWLNKNKENPSSLSK